MAEGQALRGRAPPPPRARAGRRRAARSASGGRPRPRAGAPRSRLITRVVVAAQRLDPADHAGAAAEGDDRDSLGGADLDRPPQRLGVGGHQHRVGSVLERAVAQPRQVDVAASRRRGAAGPRRRRRRSPPPPRRPAPAAAPRAAGSSNSPSSRASGHGSSSPIRSRSTAKRLVVERRARSTGPPTPTTSRRAAAAHVALSDYAMSSRSHPSALSIPSSASSRTAPWPRRISGEPSRDIPFSVCTAASFTSVPPSVASQPDLHPRGLQVPLERRPLQLLLPDVALALGRADAAVVGPHARAPRRSPAPSSSGCAGRRSPSTFSTRAVRGHQRGRL